MLRQWKENVSSPSTGASTPTARPLSAPPHPAESAGRASLGGPDPAAKLLIVGPEITLSGEITACDRLVVEGSVHVTLNRTRAIEIAPSGRFTDGKAEVEEAEIGGVYEGELTVRGRLLIRSTGRVSGRVRYGELEIERGGRLAGAVETLEAAAVAPTPVRPEPRAAASKPEEVPPAEPGRLSA
jgi:cytoskeletal protein CcmA (bactofilin family)